MTVDPHGILKPAASGGDAVPLLDRVRALVSVLPEAATVTLPVADLRKWIAEEPAPRPATARSDRPEESDRSLTVKQVAERLGVAQRWVYDHGEQLGARRLSRRCVRFSERAVERWLSQRS